mmetsp:Transcript_27677/g.46339  ORF Transcript_27677/g.46339 Transcript_27677/m.46339 type:complete len:207 (-) Transcript_27677:286-906(-)
MASAGGRRGDGSSRCWDRIYELHRVDELRRAPVLCGVLLVELGEERVVRQAVLVDDARQTLAQHAVLAHRVRHLARDLLDRRQAPVQQQLGLGILAGFAGELAIAVQLLRLFGGVLELLLQRRDLLLVDHLRVRLPVHDLALILLDLFLLSHSQGRDLRVLVIPPHLVELQEQHHEGLHGYAGEEAIEEGLHELEGLLGHPVVGLA